jgi:uncharacterized protein
MIPKTLVGYSVQIDGYPYTGKVEEGTLPKVALATEEWSGGGLGATVDISLGILEKLEWDVTLAEIDPAAYGLVGFDDIGITFRGAISDGQVTQAVIVETRGQIKIGELGPWKGRDKGSCKLTGTAKFLYVGVGGREVIYIDVENMVFRSLGVDHFAAIRAALGL